MKVKLLKKLRKEGRDEIVIYSTIESSNHIVGMSMGYNNHSDNRYDNLFKFGDTPQIVKEKAMNIYMSKNINLFRKKYKKYSRKNKTK